MISKAKRERFDLSKVNRELLFQVGREMFALGHQAGRQQAAAENVDCQMCASDDARKALGFSCNEWKAFCGPQGLDCPSVACSDPDAS